MNLDRECQALLGDSVGPGNMSSLAYDTAWVARLIGVDKGLGFTALDWICHHQLEDGSWGAPELLYHHDRIIGTLAAMIALSYGRRASDKDQIHRGLAALEHMTSTATTSLQSDPNGGTVAFEMIAPPLVAEAEKLGIIQRQGDRILGRISAARKRKLNLVGDRKINKLLTLAFSAEMAGLDGQDRLDIPNLQETNGSCGNSPSATAYYVLRINSLDSKALTYLRNGIRQDGGAPDLFPFDIYEASWIIWNLSLANWSKKTLTMFNPYLEYLRKGWSIQGIGSSTTYSVPDGDDTIIAYILLKEFGQDEINFATVLGFEGKAHFLTYPLEAAPSVSVNIHALDALRREGYPATHPTVQKVISFLRQNQYDSHWFDKWQLSPFYTTAHAIIAAAGYEDKLVAPSVQWMIDSQRLDGSWGQHIPTAEETAYCMQALCLWSRVQGGEGQHLAKAAFQRALLWLQEHTEPPYPPLWIGKGLYCPERIVRSAILSALKLSEEI